MKLKNTWIQGDSNDTIENTGSNTSSMWMVIIRMLIKEYQVTKNDEFLTAIQFCIYEHVGKRIECDKIKKVLIEDSDIRNFELYKILFEKEESIIKIKLNYNAIAAAIGKWPISKYRKYTKNEVIKDIIEKVSNKRIGEYEYSVRYADGKKYISQVRLYIQENRSYLCNVVYHKYYLIII